MHEDGCDLAGIAEAWWEGMRLKYQWGTVRRHCGGENHGEERRTASPLSRHAGEGELAKSWR